MTRVNEFGNVCNLYYSFGRGDPSTRLMSRGFGVSIRLLNNGSCTSIWNRFPAIQASGCHCLAVETISNGWQITNSCSQDESNESTLILLRHGESMWNVKNLFTGCIDVPLTERGVGEAIDAGRRISNLPIDIIFTSALIRSKMTTMLAMTQHRCNKVPIILHDENEQTNIRSSIYSEETKKQCIPVVTTWKLNERMYGELQGFNKQDTAEIYGKEQVHKWRRSYETSPPNGESLEICAQRAVAYFKSHIKPQLSHGMNVLVTAHANSLRSIIMYLDNLTSQEVINLELLTGVPMLYIYKEGKFFRRGSPAGPAEASVYAYSQSLAVYRCKMDEMLQ